MGSRFCPFGKLLFLSILFHFSVGRALSAAQTCIEQLSCSSMLQQCILTHCWASILSHAPWRHTLILVILCITQHRTGTKSIFLWFSAKISGFDKFYDMGPCHICDMTLDRQDGSWDRSFPARSYDWSTPILAYIRQNPVHLKCNLIVRVICFSGRSDHVSRKCTMKKKFMCKSWV